MTLDEYLAGEFRGRARRGEIGQESDWLEFCELDVRTGQVQVVDASYVPDPEEGCLVELAAGGYRVQVKAMAYGEDVRISRLRVVRSGVRPSIGPQIGETGTDTANIGVCDHGTFAQAWGDDNKGSWEIISPAIKEAALRGVAVLDLAVGAVMPFVSSGFGDGTFPVHELLVDGARCGFEAIFIRPDQKYPF